MGYMHSTEGDLGEGFSEPPLPPVPNVQLTEPQLRFQPNRPSFSPGQLRLQPMNVPFSPIRPGGPLLPPRGLPRLTVDTALGPQLRIDGYAPGVTALSDAQKASIRRFVDHLATRSANDLASIRFVSFRGANERDVAVGFERAQSVLKELIRQLCPLNPMVASMLQLLCNDCNTWPEPPHVDVYIAGRGVTPHMPCTSVYKEAQFTAAASCKMPPLARPGRSFNDAFWQWFNGNLDSVMNRLRVPQSWRRHIRDAAKSAVERGAEEILNHALKQTDLPSEVIDAIRGSVRAAATTPVH